MNWPERFANRTRNMKPSALREILKLTRRGGVISFAGGLPAPGLFPVERLREAADTVLTERGAEALQYGPTEGYGPLREWVAEQLRAAGAGAVTPEHVLIVSGSQQALDLLGKVFIDPGDKVLVAAPTYVGALRAFDPYEPRYLGVPTDDEGMLPDAVEAALEQRPKLAYVIPNFDNPTGVTLSLKRRERLTELAGRYSVTVIEDNPYGELRFEGAALPHLVTLTDNVVYCGTFSKIMVPGFRLAWVVAPPEVITLLTRAKQAADLHTATFTQIVAFEVTKGGFMDAQVPRVRAYYKAQRDLMVWALKTCMPPEVRFTRPNGGMFLWGTLPESLNATDIAYDAVKEDVAYVPGETFFTDGTGLNTFRLSYSVATPEEIGEGVRRLGRVFAGRLGYAGVR